MSTERRREELASDFAALARKAAAGGLQASTPKTLLHIGDERLVVLSGPGEQAATEQRLDIGVLQIARDYFHHDPPTAREIERAIDVIEDEIMRLGPRAGAGTTLWSMSDTLQAWSAVSGATMAIETVEQWFQRLAAAALGQPGAMQGLPAGREAAATLLILREFMHHLGYPAITVADAARAQD